MYFYFKNVSKSDPSKVRQKKITDGAIVPAGALLDSTDLKHFLLDNASLFFKLLFFTSWHS